MGKKIKIARRYIDLPKPYYVHAMEEVHSQTARGAVIAGTAFLDLLLRTALERLMRPLPDIQNVLFENRGALQDFAARIHAAFAFKIIGTSAYSDLCILKDIRNAFAHSAEKFDFDRPDIAALCESLWFQKHVHYEGKPDPKTPRDMFVRDVQFIADGLIDIFSQRPDSFIQMGAPWVAAPSSSPKKQHVRPSRGRPATTQKTEK
jgi:DNA-binding MltR family transcriptional regulator